MAQGRLDDSFELAQAELAEVKNSKSALFAQEVERRTEMAQRVVKRMLQGAYWYFVESLSRNRALQAFDCMLIEHD